MITIHAGTLLVSLNAADLHYILLIFTKAFFASAVSQPAPALESSKMQSLLPSQATIAAISKLSSPTVLSKQLKLVATFDRLIATLKADHSTPFAMASLEHVEITLEKTSHKLTTLVRLLSLNVIDQTGFDSIHTYIVSHNKKSEALFEISFTQYERDAIDYPGFNSLLDMKLTGLRTIFLMRFINDLVTFFTKTKFPALIDQLTKLPDLVQISLSSNPMDIVTPLAPALSFESLVRIKISLSYIEVIYHYRHFFKTIFLGSDPRTQ